MIHHTKIKKYAGTTAQLVEDIGNLRYDALPEFLDLLSNKIISDGEKNKSRNRANLATALFLCAKSLKESKIAIDKAWQICKPFN